MPTALHNMRADLGCKKLTGELDYLIFSQNFIWDLKTNYRSPQWYIY